MTAHLGHELTEEDFAEPIASYDEGPCPRMGERCPLCKDRLEKGVPSVWITIFNWSSDLTLYFHEACFRRSGFEENYRDKYLKNAYDIRDFIAGSHFWNPEYDRVLDHFDFDQAVELIVYPQYPKLEAWWDNEPALELAGKERNKGRSDPRAPFYLFDILYKSGYRQELLDIMEKLPPYAWISFSLHDDRRFQEEAAWLIGVPDFPGALERLRKSRMSLNDMLFVVETGKNNPQLLDILREAIDRYELDRSYSAVSSGFSGFDMVRYAQLCYFFASDPWRLPVLERLLTQFQFPVDAHGEFTYTKCFYFRAAVFYFLLNQTEGVKSWLSALEREIHYYPRGSPAGFINDTKRMAARYLKSQVT
ncbi:MAG TPA: hypothetical protein VK436_15635 [Methanocella sp.]|nr:hypothetical protein [Methanocella sp.]